MYKTKDISVVIPTYNRAEDLRTTIDSMNSSLGKIAEIIVADQSEDSKTKILLKRINSHKIKYIYSKTPSIAIARNLGVKNSSKNSKIICFLDDDVNIDKSYFKEIIKVFNENPSAKGAAGFFANETLSKRGKFEIFLRKIFLLDNPDRNRARIIAPYGNTYPINLNKVINAEWLPGVNMAYKKEIFKEQKFDENLLGYTIAEDTGFSYSLYRKYPDSLFITPYAKIKHRASIQERMPNQKMAYINQVDHFYFFSKNFNNFPGKMKFFWNIFGISLLRTLNFIFNPNKMNYLKLKYYFKSLAYCLNNARLIKAGNVRNFKHLLEL